MNTLTIFLLFIPVLVAILIALNFFLSVYKPDAEKVSPYECGFSPLGDARQSFSVQFYLVALLFLIFDLEVLFYFLSPLFSMMVLYLLSGSVLSF